jgi:hypothetical protein
MREDMGRASRRVESEEWARTTRFSRADPPPTQVTRSDLSGKSNKGDILVYSPLK